MPYSEERNRKNLNGFCEETGNSYASGKTFTGRGTVTTLGNLIQTGHGKGEDSDEFCLFTKENCSGSAFHFNQESLQKTFCGMMYYDENQ